MKTNGGVENYILASLTLKLVGGEWSVSRPGCFTPGEKAPLPTRARWAPELVWMMRRGEKYCFYQDLNSDLTAAQPIASHYTDCTILAPINMHAHT
jgi:hypothetical protein